MRVKPQSIACMCTCSISIGASAQSPTRSRSFVAFFVQALVLAEALACMEEAVQVVGECTIVMLHFVIFIGH